MDYYFSRKRNAGTVHVVYRSWTLCNREGPWPRGLMWWIVAGYPLCKACRRKLEKLLKERRDREQQKDRIERKRRERDTTTR